MNTKGVYKIEQKVDNNPTGWYFVDETQQLVGPYKSKLEALTKLKEYGDWLTTGE